MKKEKNILVTGAARGIGRALALGLAEAGYPLLVTSRDLPSAEEVAHQICIKGGKAEAFKLDVSKQEEIDGVVGKVQADILINNAGIQHVAKLEEFPVDRWRLLNDILLVGPAMLTRGFLPKMKQAGFGRIINIGSIHSLVASPYKSAYVAAKHGLIGFSKVVALETSEFDITINTICPAYVKTDLVEKQIAQQALQHGISEEQVINEIMLKPMPKKSFISFEELLSSVEFFISPAARNITGQSLVLDGGWTIR